MLRATRSGGENAEIAGDTVSRTLATLALNPAPVVEDPDLLWSNEPGAVKTQPINPRPFGREPTWTARINSEGFRGDERTAGNARPFRVLCVGDSITFGFNVDQDETWPAQIGRLLKERYPERSFEIVNAAVPGWSWVQGLRFLELRGLDLEPDVVVMGHGTNDQFFQARITDEERLLALGGRFERIVRRLSQRLVQTNLYRLLGRPPDRTENANSPECEKQVARRGSCRRVPLEQIEAAVERVVRVTRDAGVDLLLLNTDFIGTGAAAASRRAAERVGAPLEDLVLELAERTRTVEDERTASLGLAPANRVAEEAAKARGKTTPVIFRFLVKDPAHTYRVAAVASFGRAARLEATARDDGQGGDEKAGDSVFTAKIEVPPGSFAVEYRFLQDGVADFTPLPPLESSLSGRLLPPGIAGYRPVEVFGESPFMAERAHPNANGQKVIAEVVAGRLAGLPSWPAKR